MKFAVIDDNDTDLLVYFDLVEAYGLVKPFNNPEDWIKNPEFYDFIICDHRYDNGQDWTSILNRIDPITEMFVVSNYDVKDYKNEFDLYVQMRTIEKFPNVHHIRKDKIDDILKYLDIRYLKEDTFKILKQTFPK